MVAYSFAPRFADQVAALTKRQTIRGHRKRHARVGEPVQLFVGMRTKHCRKLVTPDPLCTGVTNIEIWVSDGTPIVRMEGGEKAFMTDAFARADGFRDTDDFAAFWMQAHGGPHVGEIAFDGVMIQWEPAP